MGSEMCIRDSHKVVQEVDVETKTVDASGAEVTVVGVERQLICNYEIHVTGIYTDIGSSSATATLAVRYDQDGWKYFDMPMTTISIAGRDFADFLMSKLILVCLLYTSDAADDMQCVDLGGRRIIKKCSFGRSWGVWT